MPHGAVVAIVTVVGLRRVTKLITETPRRVVSADGVPVVADMFGDFAVGRCLWVLGDIQKVDPPVKARGRQSLWDFDESLIPIYPMEERDDTPMHEDI